MFLATFVRGHVTAEAPAHHPRLDALGCVHHGVQTAADHRENLPLGFGRQSHRVTDSLDPSLFHVLDPLPRPQEHVSTTTAALGRGQSVALVLYLVDDWDQCVVVLVLVLVKLV